MLEKKGVLVSTLFWIQDVSLKYISVSILPEKKQCLKKYRKKKLNIFEKKFDFLIEGVWPSQAAFDVETTVRRSSMTGDSVGQPKRNGNQ